MKLAKTKIGNKTLAVVVVEGIEHAHRWPCHVCGEKSEPSTPMYDVHIPWTSDYLDMTICARCRLAIAAVLVHPTLDKP